MNTTTHYQPEEASVWAVVVETYFSYALFGCFAIAYIFRAWTWILPALFVMLCVPVLDMLSGEDLTTRQSPSGCFAARLLAWAPHGFIVGHAVCIVVVAHAIHGLSVGEFVFATLSIGIIGSIAIAAAHELIHKSSSCEKAFGRLGLTSTCYLHFEINHLRGHHVHVGTPLDQSTAWKGESLYSYIYRTVPGCWRSSWRLENQRLQNRGLDRWSFRNQMLQFVVLQMTCCVALAALGGWRTLGFFLAQSAVAIFMLEAVAYVEHYGLLREKRSHERYGNMAAAHSWDSYHRFSNCLTFHLQRHADHHAAPRKSHAELQPRPSESLRLPAGYPAMVTLAMAPGLWRRVMDVRIPCRSS